MSRFVRAALAAAAVLAFAAPAATAHESSPKYQSFYDGTRPAVPGLHAEVLGYDNQYELVNQTGKTVVVYGYDGEPYARILANGTVEVNQRSPAYYLNQDRYGAVKVPASANANAPPLWRVQDQSNRFVWHDHRMHWMAHTIPPQVKDQHRRTTIFHYAIPVRVSGRPADITGTLVWLGTPKGFPVGAIIALIVIALLGIGFVVFVRRRRALAAAGGAPAGSAGGEASKEAW